MTLSRASHHHASGDVILTSAQEWSCCSRYFPPNQWSRRTRPSAEVWATLARAPGVGKCEWEIWGLQGQETRTAPPWPGGIRRCFRRLLCYPFRFCRRRWYTNKSLSMFDSCGCKDSRVVVKAHGCKGPIVAETGYRWKWAPSWRSPLWRHLHVLIRENGWWVKLHWMLLPECFGCSFGRPSCSCSCDLEGRRFHRFKSLSVGSFSAAFLWRSRSSAGLAFIEGGYRSTCCRWSQCRFWPLLLAVNPWPWRWHFGPMSGEVYLIAARNFGSRFSRSRRCWFGNSGNTTQLKMHVVRS